MVSVSEHAENEMRRLVRPRSVPPIRLGDLWHAVGGWHPGHELSADQAALEVSGITQDSRLVARGDLYLALPGAVTHGARYADAAAASGAAIVLTDVEGAALTSPGVPVLIGEGLREVAPRLAAAVYGRPAESLTMFAITGTNGKTTTSYLLEAALRSADHSVGVIGTIGFLVDNTILESVRTTITTPESPELQAVLAVMREREAQSVVMEVSSHALVWGRTEGIVFEVAGFTNFGRDHLDFHGTEEAYFEAKASLFTAAHTKRAVINIDDPRGVEIIRRARAAGEIEVYTTSLRPGADFSVESYQRLPDGGSEVLLNARGSMIRFRCALPGDFNVHNAITALAMLDVVGVDPGRAARGIATARVPGRMQRVELGEQAPTVFIDFAHTPQAVEAVLRSLSPGIADAVAGESGEAGRKIAVLGCGGDRDHAKRAPMGAAAAHEADVVIVTDDNPRSEDAAVIRAEVLAGARSAQAESDRKVVVVDGGDRRSAIAHALQLASPRDVIAVLGKGHEEGQEIDGEVLPFNDAEVVATEWQRSSGAKA